MKDYSMSTEERKDFVLGYEPTNDGNIIIKWASGKSWTIPYTKKHEEILLNKMMEQVEGTDEFYKKKKFEIFSGKAWSIVLISMALIVFASGFAPEVSNSLFLFSVAGGLGCLSIPFIINTLKINSVLKDLEKNKRFLEIEEIVNDNVRSNQNVLANVSTKTKRIIEDLPEDKVVFNINSFNYVPFKDLEQIVENIERNERFGFEYDSEEVIDTSVKRKVRKM